MTEDVEISLYSCGLPQEERQFAVPPPEASAAQQVISVSSDGSDKSGYSIVDHVARSFRGWITVSAECFRRAVACVKEFCRVVFSAEATFNRAIFARVGGLRL